VKRYAPCTLALAIVPVLLLLAPLTAAAPPPQAGLLHSRLTPDLASLRTAQRAVKQSPFCQEEIAAPPTAARNDDSATVVPPQATQVDADVWEAIEAGGEAEILILLRQQADLSGADALPTREARGRYVYDALWTTAREGQRGLRSWLDAQGIDYQPFYIVNAVKTRAGGALVRALAARHDVARILPNPQVRGIPPELPKPSAKTPQSALAVDGIEANLIRVNADDVWALGYTGQGIVVAGQDTGYDWDHPALVNQYRGWDGTTADHDYNWHDAIHTNDPHTALGNICGFDSPVPCDDHGHGTHTMGIMVGDDGATNQIGMAPGARWIGCRNMEQGWGTPASYMECFEFFLAPYPIGGTPDEGEPSLAPHVVNNSWGCPPTEGCDAAAIALLEASVQALQQAGILVVASAGNYGPTCSTVLYPPAIYPQSTTVGNFNHLTDTIYWSSSRGPVTYGGATYTKPDISAPGVEVYSSIRYGLYGTMTGTSMAGPHVAGAAALLLSAEPGYAGHVEAIEFLLLSSTEPMTTTEGCGGDGPTDVPNNTWGWGILDALATVERATAGFLEGMVTDADTKSPIAGAEVTAQLVMGPAGPTSTTDAGGQYSMTLALGSYDVTARAWGYYPQTATNVVISSMGARHQDFQLLPFPRVYLPLIVRDW
jgi:serine protease AprX